MARELCGNMRNTQKRTGFWLKGSWGDRITALLASYLRDTQVRAERNQKNKAYLGFAYFLKK